MEELKRCPWVIKDELYRQYHDNEWGVPVYDDQLLFEYLVLESFQAGLSWHTVLKKRENFRKALDHFNFKLISAYGEDKVNTLIQDAGIIRNIAKVRATINNAAAFLEIRKEFGSFSEYIWRYTGGKPIVNQFRELSDYPTSTSVSDEISRDLKKRGFKFLGTTVIYAHMQATGMVNDHTVECFRHKEVQLLVR